MQFLAVLLFLSLGIQSQLAAQNIAIFQYRRVPGDHMEEFLKRETTYWSKVAKKAIEKGNLQSWALLQKVGGTDLENAPNILFINIVKDLDAMNGMWDAAAVFPDVPMEKMETNSMSTTTSAYLFSPQSWVEAPNTKPEDLRYVKINFINSSNASQLISLEKEYWLPFITAAMAKEGTSQVAWGNAGLIYPYGPDIPFSSISFDVYSSLHETMLPKWAEGTEIPQDGLDKINEITLHRRSAEIYRIVMSVDAETQN